MTPMPLIGAECSFGAFRSPGTSYGSEIATKSVCDLCISFDKTKSFVERILHAHEEWVVYMPTLKKRENVSTPPLVPYVGLGAHSLKYVWDLCISFDKTKSFIERIVHDNFHVVINISLTEIFTSQK